MFPPNASNGRNARDVADATTVSVLACWPSRQLCLLRSFAFIAFVYFLACVVYVARVALEGNSALLLMLKFRGSLTVVFTAVTFHGQRLFKDLTTYPRYCPAHKQLGLQDRD